MYKVDIEEKRLILLESKQFSELGLLERFDIQEWIDRSPAILGEELLVIAKELSLPSGIRLDLLAIDRNGNLVIIELKRDDSGRDIEWQAIKYASYCSNFLPNDLFQHYATYLEVDEDEAQLAIEEFMDAELDALNKIQRIILAAQSFHSDVASAVLWLRDFGLDISCVRLRAYMDQDEDLFINPEVIIPLPEAQDYIQRKEAKQQESKRSTTSSFSLEIGSFGPEELKKRLRATLARKSDLTPRIVVFLEILLSEDRPFDREEIKEGLLAQGIGNDFGHSGRHLSNISQFLTKKSNPHLRQVISFETRGGEGETKDNYLILPEYRDLLSGLVSEWHENQNVNQGVSKEPSLIKDE